MDIEELTRFRLFQGLDEDQIAHLLFGKGRRKRKYSEGKTLYYQGDAVEGLHLLVEGSVITSMNNEEGKSITVETLTAPSLMAPAFVFASDNHFPVHVEAKTDCEVITISKEQLMRLMATYPSLMMGVMQIISDRCAFLTKRLRGFAITNLKQRILQYLRENGEIKNQNEVAKVLGVARPSLTKALAELEREGLI